MTTEAKPYQIQVNHPGAGRRHVAVRCPWCGIDCDEQSMDVCDGERLCPDCSFQWRQDTGNLIEDDYEILDLDPPTI